MFKSLEMLIVLQVTVLGIDTFEIEIEKRSTVITFYIHTFISFISLYSDTLIVCTVSN